MGEQPLKAIAVGDRTSLGFVNSTVNGGGGGQRSGVPQIIHEFMN